MKITIFISMLLLLGISAAYYFDPAFESEVKFDEFSTKYEWRIFNNSYCNSKTYGHCFTNEINKLNAEIELYRQLLENYNGEKLIESKLKKAINESVRFKTIYTEITNSKNIEIDSLKKIKDVIFAKIRLK